MAATPPVEDDFDAWFTQNVSRYRFKLLGQTWELPGAAPAVTVLRYQKLMSYVMEADLPDGAEVTAADLPEGMNADDLSFDSVLREFAGEDMVEEWLKLGLTDEHIPHVAQRLIDRYVLGNKASDATGKAPKTPQDRKPPARKRTASTRRSSSPASSSAGQPSKPAGTPSTTETSTRT